MTRSIKQDLEAQDALARHVVETIAVGFRHGRDRSEILQALIRSEAVRERGYLADDWDIAFGLAERLVHEQNQAAARGGTAPAAHGPGQDLSMPVGLAWAGGVFAAYWVGRWVFEFFMAIIGLFTPYSFTAFLDAIYLGQLVALALGVWIYAQARAQGGRAGIIGAAAGFLAFCATYFVYLELRLG